MATAAEKESKQAAQDAARSAVTEGKQRLETVAGKAAKAFSGRRLRSAGDLTRYRIGGFLDDPMGPNAGVGAKPPRPPATMPGSRGGGGSQPNAGNTGTGTSAPRAAPTGAATGAGAAPVGPGLVQNTQPTWSSLTGGGLTPALAQAQQAASLAAATQKGAAQAEADRIAAAGADSPASLLAEQALRRQLQAAPQPTWSSLTGGGLTPELAQAQKAAATAAATQKGYAATIAAKKAKAQVGKDTAKSLASEKATAKRIAAAAAAKAKAAKAAAAQKKAEAQRQKDNKALKGTNKVAASKAAATKAAATAKAKAAAKKGGGTHGGNRGALR